MFRKKILSILLACSLVIPMSNYVRNEEVQADTANLIYHDFEGDLYNWVPRGVDEEEVTLTKEEAYSGEYSIKISNRTNTWHGATCDMTEELTLGETYDFGMWFKYTGNSYSNTQNFNLQLQYNDGVSDVYKNIKTAAVTKGNWTHLTGQYTIPTDATNVQFYVESEWKQSPSSQDLMDFYIDDFTATPAALPEIQKDIVGLKDVFPSFKIGCAATAGEIAPKPAKDLVNKHYNSLTLGNELKPDSVLDYDATIAYMESEDGDQVNPQVNLRAARTLLEFARDNNIPVRGHTLVWHNQTPDWFFKVDYSKDANAEWASKDVMKQRLENYIKNVMTLIATNYPTVEFYAWDVVNEAVDPDTSDGMRRAGSNNVSSGSSAWMQTMGSDFIEYAFTYARKYAPEGCKLFYNDYNEYESKKSGYIFNILSNLVDKGLVDGMGMQSHWIMQYPSLDMFETSAKLYDSLGLEIQLTELDIANTDNSTSGLASQATRYKQLMTKVIELKNRGVNITAVVFWGITDATSWLGGYPLLFDGDYQAKPAFYSIVDSIPTATPTPMPPITPTPTPTPIRTTQPPITPTPSPTPICSTQPPITPTPTPTPVCTTQPPAPIVEGTPVVSVNTTNSGNTINQVYNVTVSRGYIDLSKLVITYSADGMGTVEQNVWIDDAAIQLNVEPYYVSFYNAVSGNITNGVLSVSFNNNREIVAGTGSLTFTLRFAKSDWSNYNTFTNEVVHIYYDGIQIQ